MSEKYFYSYDEFVADNKKLIEMISPYAPDMIVGLSRGGVVPALFLSEGMDIQNYQTINASFYDENNNRMSSVHISNFPKKVQGKKIIIIDEIIDSGETAHAVVQMFADKYPEKQVKFATIFYKKHSTFEADFKLHETDKWVEFFWEIDSLPHK